MIELVYYKVLDIGCGNAALWKELLRGKPSLSMLTLSDISPGMLIKAKETRWCLPGGGIDKDENPSDACLRELFEECKVKGTIVRKTSEINYGKDDNHYNYLVDIGEQTPSL